VADLGPWLWAEVRRIARAEAEQSVLGYNPDLTRAQGPLPSPALVAHASTHHSGGTDPVTLQGIVGNQAANVVAAGPASGAPGAVSWRALVADDIPSLNASKIGAGEVLVERGGTGLGSYAIGDLLYASGATTLAALADVATGNALLSGGVDTAPAWGKVGLTTHVSGVLASANGGTGIDNGGRTLTVATNSGTLAFAAASSTLTIPATGTAVLGGGSGASTRLAYWTGANELTSDANLVWVAATGNFGVGSGTGFPSTAVTGHFRKDANGDAIVRVQNATAGAAARAYFQIVGDAAGLVGYFGVGSSTHSTLANTFFMLTDSGAEAILIRPTTGSTRVEKATALTNTVQEVLQINHTSSGTPAAGFGSRLLYRLESSTTTDQDAVALEAIWGNATHASRSAYLSIKVASTALAEVARFDKPTTATQTGLMLYDVDNNTVERVTGGAADSGGTGFKVLRIPN
jgi:hypothetical protein